MPPNHQNTIVASANFRDLGGMATTDGYVTRHGRLYRSGHLQELTVYDAARINALGLATIVDLRRPAEVASRPTPTFGSERNVNISASVEADEFASVAALALDPAMAGRATALALQYYRENVGSRLDLYVPVFHQVMEPANHPLLFHCTAGKDRTGFVAAIVLGLLGVRRETIIADYLATNDLRSAWIAQHVLTYRARIAEQRGISVAEVSAADLASSRVVLIAEAAYIEASLDAVQERFGSWQALRTEGLGIDEETFDRFRRSLLQ